MREPGKLCDLAQAEISALVADGLSLSPEEIVRINHLAWQASEPEGRLYLSRGVPVRLGGAVLWPLTLYGMEWFQRVGLELKDWRGDLSAFALAYAMCYGRGQGQELEVSGPEAAAAVRKWASGLRCRARELEAAVANCIEQEQLEDLPTGHDPDPMAPGDLSAFLAASGGGPVDQWERQVSIGYVRSFVSAIVRHESDGQVKGMADPKVQALKALGLYVEEIRRSRQPNG